MNPLQRKTNITISPTEHYRAKDLAGLKTCEASLDYSTSNMETERDLNLRIINITVQIQEFYPELYRDLNEMFATLPISETPVINATTLRKWLDSLKILIKRYNIAHQQ